jgi:hypothetical protein
MRTYDDTFSGEKIYPGKVLFPNLCDVVLGGEASFDGFHQEELGHWIGIEEMEIEAANMEELMLIV